MAFTSAVMPLPKIDRYAEDLVVRRIRNLSGVSKALIGGEQKYAVRIELVPGMAVTVEIKTGSRRVIEYLLSPLLRYKQESLRER